MQIQLSSGQVPTLSSECRQADQHGTRRRKKAIPAMKEISPRACIGAGHTAPAASAPEGYATKRPRCSDRLQRVRPGPLGLMSRGRLVLTVSAMVLALAGCTDNDWLGTQSADAPVTLSLGTPGTAGSASSDAAQYFADIVNQE